MTTYQPNENPPDGLVLMIVVIVLCVILIAAVKLMAP